jgi:hypothetical protein
MADRLLHSEHVTYRTGLHVIRVLRPGTVLAGGLFLVARFLLHVQSLPGGAPLEVTDGQTALVVYGGWAGFLMLFSAPYLLAALVDWLTGAAVVTNKRVLVKVGLLRRRSLELLHHQVEGIYVERSILGMILGYGTVVVTGTGGSQETFRDFCRPLDFRREVQEQIELCRQSAAGWSPATSFLPAAPTSAVRRN